MALLLDTDTVPAADRCDALAATFDASEVPQRVWYAAAPQHTRHRLEMFRYGPSVRLLHNAGTGLMIDRTDRHVRQGAPMQLAVFMQRRGVGYLERGDVATIFRPGDIGLMDTTRPYAWRQSRRSDHYVLLVDDLGTGLTVEQLRTAGDQLPRSPLYGMARAQFESLCDSAADLAPEAMVALGRVVAQLLHAAVVTSIDGADAGECRHGTLFPRVAAYADTQLHDPNLTPRQLADAHFISVRHLYNIWARETGQSPSRWIMSRRLERAGDLLSTRHRRVLPISWVARQCGFTNMSHFSRRFRQTYGMSPRDWSVNHHQS